MPINRGVKITGIVLGALAGLVVLLTFVGYLLPSQVKLVNISATLDASSTELFPFFNSRAGQQRMWTQAAQRLEISDAKLSVLLLGRGDDPFQPAGRRFGFWDTGQDIDRVLG